MSRLCRDASSTEAVDSRLRGNDSIRESGNDSKGRIYTDDPATILTKNENSSPNVSMLEAVRNPNMILLLIIFALIFFCNQIVNVHIVNYATDIGIVPLVAATFIGVIGVVSIAGRLTMGVWSDRISMHNSLIICCVLLVVSLTFLVFTNTLWAFYLFAVVFGFCYGGEVPLIPLFISNFFGTRTMASLMGILIFVANIGGALGPWLSGKIFDSTGSYTLAFVIAASAGLMSLILAIILKKRP